MCTVQTFCKDNSVSQEELGRAEMSWTSKLSSETRSMFGKVHVYSSSFHSFCSGLALPSHETEENYL